MVFRPAKRYLLFFFSPCSIKGTKLKGYRIPHTSVATLRKMWEILHIKMPIIPGKLLSRQYIEIVDVCLHTDSRLNLYTFNLFDSYLSHPIEPIFDCSFLSPFLCALPSVIFHNAYECIPSDSEKRNSIHFFKWGWIIITITFFLISIGDLEYLFSRIFTSKILCYFVIHYVS